MVTSVISDVLPYDLDSNKIIEMWKEEISDRYLIEGLSFSEDGTGSFLFSFKEDFINEVIEGYKSKNIPQEKMDIFLSVIFNQTHKVELKDNGIFQVVINVEDLSTEQLEMVEVEAKFQFYHVAKTLVETLRKNSYIGIRPLTLHHISSGDAENLERKLYKNYRKTILLRLKESKVIAMEIRDTLSKIKPFPLGILFKYSLLNIINDVYENYRLMKEFSESELSRIKRIGTLETDKYNEYIPALLKKYDILAERVENMRDLLMSQFQISGVFLGLLGLDFALLSVFFPLLLPKIFLSVSGVILLLILGKYSVRSALKKEVDHLMRYLNEIALID